MFMQSTICTDALDKLYKEVKGRGVTMSALISKACGVALAAHPRLWAACTPDGAGITYNDHINIANAVAMDGGLITPVLKDADTTDIYTMSRTWKVSILCKKANYFSVVLNAIFTAEFSA